MMRLVLVFGVLVLMVAACGDSGTTDPGGVDSGSDIAGGEDTPQFCMSGSCETPDDCPPASCAESVACVLDCCEYTFVAEGTPCHDGCMADGVCSVSGACLGTTELSCAEEDGNPCTAPACDPKTGTCVETPLPDGESVVSSYCWEGIVCTGGAPDDSVASSTALALDCQAQDGALDPMGCVQEILCVDSEEACVEILAQDGSQCWSGVEGQSDGTVCIGQSCLTGECKVDHTFDEECGEDAFSDGCDMDCQVCTSLTCIWIVDPANPDSATEMVRYCQPEALVGEACDDGNGCTVGDACVLDQTGDGPLGKETLGFCEPGEGMTKDECLADMELPALPCLKAGVTCDLEDGCTLDQDVADAWCTPPGGCVNAGLTFCTHIDLADGNWNEDTGCHVVLFDDNCDDGIFCTEDLCDSSSGCLYSPKVNGTPCGEDMECQGGVCVETCVADCGAKVCGDDGCGGSCGVCNDANFCTLDICADGGVCTFPAGNDGAACNGAGICVGACQAGACVETAVEVCNAVDDDCDGQVDEGDLCPPGSSCDGGMCKEDCTPLDGGWTDWVCGACSLPCGGGTQDCTRSCTNPPPSCGGAQCSGSTVQSQACSTQDCSNELPTGTTVLSDCQTIVTGEVPMGKTSVQFKLWGGGGGGGAPGSGGGAAFVMGTLAVQPGDEIELRVACGGEEENGGGGATYIFKNSMAVMIAAGGGGGGSDGCSGCHKTTSPTTGQGGAGGAVGGAGEAGKADNTYNAFIGGGQGGSQGAGGAGGTSNDQSAFSGCVINGFPGSAHTGGLNTKSTCADGYAASYQNGGNKGGGNGSGGGGGAGHFGGGGGAAKYTYNGGGGGGGSSWIGVGVSSMTSEGGVGQNPGGMGVSGYQGTAGEGGQGQTDSFEDHLDSEPGSSGLIIMTL